MLLRIAVAVLIGAIALATSMVTPGRAHDALAAAFNPQVSVWISDDTPGGHPDITITIDVAEGPIPFKVETLMPAGGSTYLKGALPAHLPVGSISGFIGIPGTADACGERYTFNDVTLAVDDPDTASFPPYLRDLAPGEHLGRYTAEVGGAPVNFIIDEVQVAGESRLRATTFIGDPTHPFPNCTPFRGRIIILGQVSDHQLLPPVLTAPPTAGPRVFDFTLTSRADASGNAETAQQTVTAVVVPGIQLRRQADRLAWNSVPGDAAFSISGSLVYMTTCPLVRRLIIKEQDWDLSRLIAVDSAWLPLPTPPPDFELASINATLLEYDPEGVLLARGDASYARDFASCWYPPGQEPLLHVAPETGSCTGDVEFTGERFPTGVNVEVTMAPFNGSVSSSGPRVALAPVAADGTLTMKAALTDAACVYASMSGDNTMSFYAYNADEPHAMTAFAGVNYIASASPGYGPPLVTAPVTGSGPSASERPWLFRVVLAIVGAMLVGGGVVARRA